MPCSYQPCGCVFLTYRASITEIPWRVWSTALKHFIQATVTWFETFLWFIGSWWSCMIILHTFNKPCVKLDLLSFTLSQFLLYFYQSFFLSFSLFHISNHFISLLPSCYPLFLSFIFIYLHYLTLSNFWFFLSLNNIYLHSLILFISIGLSYLHPTPYLCFSLSHFSHWYTYLPPLPLSYLYTPS